MKVSASVIPETGHIGSLYVRFTDERVAETVALKDPNDPEVLLDLSQDKQLVGIEILAEEMLRKFCALLVKDLPREYASKVEQVCGV